MSREHVDIENLKVNSAGAPSEDGPLSRFDDVIIVVKQAFGPKGDNLIGITDTRFDGFAAVTLLVRAAGREELVDLSPMHGDMRKKGFEGLPNGTRCELLCPVSRLPLHRIGRVFDHGDAEYYGIYLTPKLDEGSMIYVSNIWGHHHSRIVDNNELISDWARAMDERPE